MTRGRYCIIGAGAAGLGALKVLLDEGFSVDCFERSDRVGGHWHTDYECLHLITPRGSSGFEGSPMPADYPLFPSRDQMRDYIVGFAAEHGLEAHIAFNTEVTAARPLDGPAAGWEVTTADGERRRYDGVIVANGHLWDPFVPEYPGRFDGQVLHSAEYRNAGDLAASGCSWSAPATRAATWPSTPRRRAATPYVSVRDGLMFQPKTLFGRPRSELPLLGRLPVAPAGARDARADRRLARRARALRPARARDAQPAPQQPVVNGQLLHFIHHGRVHVVPASSASTATRPLHRRHVARRSTRSCSRPASRSRCRSWTPRCSTGTTASRCAWPA